MLLCSLGAADAVVLRFRRNDRFLAHAQLNYDRVGNLQPGREALDETVVFSVGCKW